MAWVNAPGMPTLPAAGVIATSPATAPEAAPSIEALPRSIASPRHQASTAAEVAMWERIVGRPLGEGDLENDDLTLTEAERLCRRRILDALELDFDPVGHAQVHRAAAERTQDVVAERAVQHALDGPHSEAPIELADADAVREERVSSRAGTVIAPSASILPGTQYVIPISRLVAVSVVDPTSMPWAMNWV